MQVSTRMVSSLVRYGCDINVADSQGRTALHHVSRLAAGVDAFLSVAGCNVNVQDLDGNTPLTLASIEGFDEVVKSLLQSGANPNIKNARNKAPLHYLAMKNHWVAIEAIVDNSVTFPDDSAPDVNVATWRGKTPLWYAVNRNRPEAVKALLIANCRPDVTPAGHEVIAQPVELALNKGLYELAKLLALAGCCQHPVRQWLSRTDLAASLHQRDANAAAFQTADAGTSETRGNERNELEQELLKEAKEWFTEWTTSPHSLMQLCRIHVRRMLGNNRVSVKIGQLPVPCAVHNYLALTEIKDHYVKGYLI
jgi:ankyrin repeat protein